MKGNCEFQLLISHTPCNKLGLQGISSCQDPSKIHLKKKMEEMKGMYIGIYVNRFC